MRGRTWVALLAVVAVASTADAQEAPRADAAPAPVTSVDDLVGFWDLRMERTVWWPYLVPGSLTVSRGPKGVRGSLTFDPMWGVDPKPLNFLPASGNELRFEIAGFAQPIATVTGTVRDGVFVGQIEWQGAKPTETCFISAERVAPLRRFEPDSSTRGMPLEKDPGALGVDVAALDRLLHYAGRNDTDVLLVAKDGRLLCDRTFLRPRALCAIDRVTEGIAALAVPLLVEDKKLPRDLDVPLTRVFPEWSSDARKSRITLRHVLSHSTGLAQYASPSAESDYLASARASASVRDPGAAYEPNALAFELLSGIVATTAGEQLDTYLERRLFKPMGITRWRWPRDAAGTVPAYGALDLEGPDLLRIASMLANGGTWQSKQIVPNWWIEAMATPSGTNEEMGLAWRLARDPRTETVVQTQAKLDRLKEGGYADASQLTPLVGKTFESRSAWWKAARDLVGRTGIEELARHLPHPAVGGEIRGPVSCVYLHGAKGQYVVLLPQQHVAIVRGRRGFAEKELPSEAARYAEFSDLPALAQGLVW